MVLLPNCSRGELCPSVIIQTFAQPTTKASNKNPSTTTTFSSYLLALTFFFFGQRSTKKNQQLSSSSFRAVHGRGDGRGRPRYNHLAGSPLAKSQTQFASVADSRFLRFLVVGWALRPAQTPTVDNKRPKWSTLPRCCFLPRSAQSKFPPLTAHKIRQASPISPVPIVV